MCEHEFEINENGDKKCILCDFISEEDMKYPLCKKRHGKLTFQICQHYYEEQCDCISEENGDLGYYYCEKCNEISEKKRNAILKKTCNVVVDCKDLEFTKNGEINSFFGSPVVFQIPHGGKPLKKRTFANINEKTGYLEKSTKEKGQFYVLK